MLVALALAMPAVGQVHPSEYVGVPGNDAAWIDGALRPAVGTIVEGVGPGTIRGVSFRSVFREERRASYGARGATTLDLSVRMSRDAGPAQTMAAGWDQHNASVQTVLPRTVVSLPSVPPQFQDGGFDAWTPEPFSHSIAFAAPYVVTATSNVHFTLELHAYWKGSIPGWDALVVDYLPPIKPPPPPIEHGSSSVFWGTVCGGHEPMLGETSYVWREGRQWLEVGTRFEPAQHVVVFSFGAGGSVFPTVHGPCATFVDLSAAVALPVHWSGQSWPLPHGLGSGQIVSHRLVIDQGGVIVSGGTRAHRSLVDWHSGRTPSVRSQFAGLGYDPRVWYALIVRLD